MDIYKCPILKKEKKVFFGPIFEMQFVTDMLTMPFLDANFVTDKFFDSFK